MPVLRMRGKSSEATVISITFMQSWCCICGVDDEHGMEFANIPVSLSF